MNHYFELLTDYFAAHPILALGIVFIIAMGEALFIVGLVVPSTVVLVSAGTLVGMGKLDFVPILTATILGAIAGDAISYWVGRKWKHQVKAVWPFNKYSFLMEKSESFFAKHGGKSIFIGRFIPGIKSVVPGIAGIMGMNAWYFTFVNVVSAVFWSLAHLLPGVVVGRGLDVAQTSNPRLLVLVVILAVIAVSTWYAFKICAGLVLPYIWKGRRRLAARLSLRKSIPGRWTARILMNRGYVVTSHTYAILAACCIVAFGVLSLLIFKDIEVLNTDHALTAYLASLRTVAIEPVIVAVGLSGSTLVLVSVSLAILIALFVMGRWQLALLVTSVIILSNLLVPVLKWIFERERPDSLISDLTSSFSFPSHQATVSLVVYGLAASLIAWNLSPYVRRYIYAFFFGLIALIGFSRVYFQAHWPSDVLAASMIGATLIFLTLYAMTRTSRFNPNVHSFSGWVLLSFVSFALVGTMSFQVSTKLSVELSKVRAAPVLKEIRKEDWLASGWRNISLSRTLFDGDVAEPMLVQTDLPKHDLKTRLLKNGWRENKLSVLATLTDSMVPSKEPLKKRSVLPSTNAGKPPVLVFQKSIGPNSKAVLRIWETDYAINGEGLFSLSLMQESLRKVPFKLSLISKQQFPQDVQVELMSSIEVALNCLKFNKQADATEISLLVRR